MKKVRYLKRFMLGAFAALIGVFISVVFFKGISVHADETIDLSYEVYSYDDYMLKFKFESTYGVDLETARGYVETYEEMINDALDGGDSLADATAAADDYWNAVDVIDISDSLQTVNNAKVTDGSGTNHQEEWWLEYPITLGSFPGATLRYYHKNSGTGNNTKYTTQSQVVDAGLGYTYTQVKTAIEAADAVESLTTVSEGDYIVIVPKIETSGVTLGGVSIGLDVTGLTAVAATSSGFSGKYKAMSDVNDPTDGIKAATSGTNTNGDSYIYYESNGDISSTITAGYSSTAKYPLLSLGDTNDEGVLCDDFNLGAVAIKVGSSVTSPFSIHAVADSDFTYAQEPDSTNVVINEHSLPLAVESSTSSVAKITKVRFNGSDYSTTSSVTLNGVTYDTFVMPKVSTTTTNFSFSVYTDKNGTIDSTAEYNATSTDGNTATMSNLSVTGAASPYTIPSTTPTTWNTGESIYVKVTVYATDYVAGDPTLGTHFKEYLVQIEKDKNTDATLTGLSASTAPSGGTAYDFYSSATATTTIPFASSTLNYYVKVPHSANPHVATTVYIKPTWDTTKNGTAKYGTDSLTSGTAFAVTLGATDATKVVTINVTAEDGTTTTPYNITLYRLDDDVSLASSNPIVVLNNASVSATVTNSGTTYSADVAFGSTTFTAKANLKNTTKQKLEYTTDTLAQVTGGTATWTSINSGVATPTQGFSSGTAGDTKTIFFRVTAEDGTTKQVYQVDAVRSGGNKNSILTTPINIRYDGGVATAITMTTTPDATDPTNKETGTATINNIAYKTKGVELQVTCDAANGQSISYRYMVSSGSFGSPVNSNSGVWTSKMFFDTASASSYGVTTATSIIIEVTVKAQDTSYASVYTITVNRKAASTDVDLDGLNIYLTKTGSADYQIVTPTPDTSVASNHKYIYATNVDYTYNGVKVEPSFDALATATVGTATITPVAITSGNKSAEFPFTQKTQQTLSITVVVKAEDNSTRTYTIEVTRDAAEDDTNISISATAEDGTNIVLGTPVQTGNKFTYTATNSPLDFENRYLEIALSMTSATSRSKIKADLYDINGNVTSAAAEVSDNVARNYYIDFNSSPVVAATTKTYTFKLYTEKENTTGYTVEIKVSRKAANNDSSITAPVFTGLDDSQGYSYKNYNSTTRTYTYEMTKSTSGTDYILDIGVNTATTKIYYSYSVPTPSSTVKLYDARFAAQFGTLYDPASTDPLDHTFTAGSTGQSLYMTVVPQSGQYKTYVFNVTYKDERQEGHVITDISVTVVGAISNTYTFNQVTALNDVSTFTQTLGSITVPYSTSTVIISVTFDSTTSNLATLNTGGDLSNQGSLPLAEGTNTFKYQGRAENTGLGCIYKFEIVRQSAKVDHNLEKLSIGSTPLVDLSDTSGTYTFNYQTNVYTAVARTTSFVYVNFTVSDFAKYIISGSSITTQSATQTTSGANNQILLTGLSPNSKYTLTLSIQSEKEVFDSATTGNSITIEIYTAEQNFKVDNIELYQDATMAAFTEAKDGSNFTYSASTFNYPTMNLYYKNNAKAYANVLLNVDSSNAVVTTDGEKTLASGLNTYTIVVKSEYAALNPAITNQTSTYTIKLNKDAPSNNAFLSNLELQNVIDSSSLALNTTFNSSDFGPYVVENIPKNSNNKALVKFIPTLSDTKATYVVVSAINDVVTLDGGSDATATITSTVSIEVTAEDEHTKKTYYVTISTGQVILNKDNSISNIVVNADNDSTTNLIAYSAGVPGYTPTTRPNVNSVNITVTVTDSKASIYHTVDGGTEVEVKGTTDTQTTKTFNVVLTNKPGNTVVEVISRAQDTTVADKKYTITIKSATPDQDRTLDTYKIEIYDDSNALKSTYNYVASDTNPTLNVKHGEVKAILYVGVHSLYSTVTPSNAGNAREYTLTKNLAIDSNSLSFVVTSEDTVSEPYNITIIRDDDNTLSSLEITEQGDTTNLITGFPSTDNTYQFDVSYSVDKLDFDYALNATNASNVTVVRKLGTSNVTGSTINLSLGTNTFVITVSAKSGDKTEYTVSINRKNGNDDNYIITYRHDNVQSEIHAYDTTLPIAGTVVNSANTIVYALDRTYNGTHFDPVLTVSPTAKEYNGKPYKIVQTNTLLAVGTNNFTIIVTSETNYDNEYNFTIYVADTSIAVADMRLYEKDTTTDLVDVNNDTLSYSDANVSYGLVYRYSQKSADLFIELASSYANVKVNGTGISKSSNPLQYKTNLNFDNSVTNPTTHIVTFTITIEAELLSYYNISDPTERAKYTKTYTITVTKETPNNDTSLVMLKVEAGGKTYNIITGGTPSTSDPDINISGNVYTLENAGSATGFTVTATPNKLPTLTSFEQLTYNSVTETASKTIQFAAQGDTSQSHIFYVYNEAHDNYTEYTIIIYRAEAIDPNTNNEITMIDLYDSLNVSYINSGVFNQGTTTYTLGANGIPTISYGLNKSYTIVVSIPSTSNAQVYIDNVAYSNKQSGAIAITYPSTGNYTKTHTVYAKSQSGVDGQVYTITVVAVRADSDAFLNNLLVDGNQVVDKNGVRFTKNNFSYDLGTYDNSYFEVAIYAQLSNSKAKAQIISSTGESYSGFDAPSIHLNMGTNTISVVVTAEDGNVTNTYQVIIFRDYEEPVLIDLEVVGEKLVNSTYNQQLDFDSEIKHYYVKVLYGTQTITVNASLSADSQNYSVVASGLTVVNNTGATRTFTTKPNEGVNNYTITVRSPQGKSTKYILTIKLNSSATASTNVNQISTISGLPGLTGVGTTVIADPNNPGQLITVLDVEGTGITELPGVQELLAEEGGTTYFKPLNSVTADYSNGDTVQKYGPYVVANRVRSVTDSILNIVPEKIKDSDGNGAQVKIINGNLGIGANTVIVQITSEDGNNVRTILLDVIRMDNKYSIAIDEIEDFEDDFDNSDVQDEYNVPSNVTELNFEVKNKDKADTNQPTFTVVNGTNLKAGRNVVKVVVTPADGTAPFEQTIVVIRAEYQFEISSKEIATLKDDFDKDSVKDNYEVNSKVDQIGFTVTNKDSNVEADQPTYVVSNSGKLSVGENNVKLTITAPDGTVSEKTIKVTRAKMSFTVNKAAYEYACEAVAGKDNYYTINLVDKTADAIDDYKKYIEFDSEKNDLEIELVSGEITKNTNEILVRVKTKDNAESEVIHFQLTSSEINKAGSMFDIIFWIILIIVIIILIIILICVNRDKYGSISKKRKNA